MSATSENSQNDALMAAAARGDTQPVRALLAGGADPNYWGKDGWTPLLRAADLGSDDIAEALLAAGADPNRVGLLDGARPLVVATLAGHDRVARLIRDRLVHIRELEAQAELERLGWSAGLPNEEAELVLTGSDPVEDRARLVDLAIAEPLPPLEAPTRTFEGWTKQLVAEDLKPFALEALEYAFPLFLDLGSPPARVLTAVSEHDPRASKPRRFRQRVRRFAGDDSLPRSRYHTLCTGEAGSDDRTLRLEMMAYSHFARTGEVELLDLTNEADASRVADLGLPASVGHGLVLVLRPGPFHLHWGLPNRAISLPLPVRVVHQRIEGVVDLRDPDTADWFARVVSRAVFEFRSPTTGQVHHFKCWPLRPPLDNFGQLLPALLTQEHGGGSVSVVAGHLLRSAGVSALIFPSARNDCFARIRENRLRRFVGWNLVDYRGATLPKKLIALDVDHEWPTGVQLGSGLAVRNTLMPKLFSDVTIDYEATGTWRGSFEVDGIVRAHASIRKSELEAFCNNYSLQPWWLL